MNFQLYTTLMLIVWLAAVRPFQIPKLQNQSKQSCLPIDLFTDPLPLTNLTVVLNLCCLQHLCRSW
uniref:Uncharacterized protein n=1 Tax=Mola mola TaxID=94237 RepID=A0A3Q3XA14_MOLML